MIAVAREFITDLTGPGILNRRSCRYDQIYARIVFIFPNGFNDMMDGLVADETQSNITASMSFTDVEGFENWISNVQPISNAPMYFLIDLHASDFTGYEFVQVDKILTGLLKNKKDVIKFVHVKNILQYM